MEDHAIQDIEKVDNSVSSDSSGWVDLSPTPLRNLLARLG